MAHIIPYFSIVFLRVVSSNLELKLLHSITLVPTMPCTHTLEVARGQAMHGVVLHGSELPTYPHYAPLSSAQAPDDPYYGTFMVGISHHINLNKPFRAAYYPSVAPRGGVYQIILQF